MILVIDNYDSFTWNLVQYLGALGAEPVVRRNDEVAVEDVATLAPRAIVLSPGPCTPAEAGVTLPIVRRWAGAIPILGVCLGHQAIGAAFGGRIVRSDRVMHGKTSMVTHTGHDIFAGLPSPLSVMRYHSLTIERASLPSELEVVAVAADAPGEIHAVRHRTWPVWGVQFHPESILTEGGELLMRNFLNEAGRWSPRW